MTSDPLRLLTANAAFQVLASCLLGAAMLVPMQPWGAGLRPRLNPKALLSAHLDWLMLAFMQWGAVLVMQSWPTTRALWIAWLLVAGGWLNATPYLFRGAGIDAFVFAGRWPQRSAAALAGLSSGGILAAWLAIAWRIAKGSTPT